MTDEIKRDSNSQRIYHRINEIEVEVVGLKVAVNAIDEKIEKQTQVITDLVKEERSNPATQIAFATLFLAMVVFYNRLTIEPVMQTIDHNKVTTDYHEEKKGHDDILLMHKDLEGRILVLEKGIK